MGTLSGIAGRLRFHWKQRGALATFEFLASRFFRHQVTRVYEACPDAVPAPEEWSRGERLQVVGAENLDSAMTPGLQRFLGGVAYECLADIRNGGKLFVITDGGEYLHRGYVVFQSRAKTLLDEPADVPLIAYCYTAPAARGRGLYRRALLGELRYLRDLGYKRVVIDTHPENHASRKGIEAAGFSFLKTVSVWIVLNLFAIRRIETGGQTRWRIVSCLGQGSRTE